MSQLILVFLVVFAGVLAAAFAGLKFHENRRQRQVAAVLQTVKGELPRVETKILKDLPGEQTRPAERLLAFFNLSGRAEAAIRQAGLDWTVERLLIMTAVTGGAGVMAGG